MASSRRRKSASSAAPGSPGFGPNNSREARVRLDRMDAGELAPEFAAEHRAVSAELGVPHDLRAIAYAGDPLDETERPASNGVVITKRDRLRDSNTCGPSCGDELVLLPAGPARLDGPLGVAAEYQRTQLAVGTHTRDEPSPKIL